MVEVLNVAYSKAQATGNIDSSTIVNYWLEKNANDKYNTVNLLEEVMKEFQMLKILLIDL